MTPNIFHLLLTLSLLFSTSYSAATPNPTCSKEPYKTLVSTLSKEPIVIKFCNNLPSTATKYASSTKPTALKSLAYTVVKTFCDCLKASQAPPAPTDDATCSAQNSTTPNFCPGPPSYCTNLYAASGDGKNCGSCGRVCPNNLPCSYGSCAQCSATVPCPNSGSDPQYCTNGYCSRCENGGTDCDEGRSPPLCCKRGPDVFESCISAGSQGNPTAICR